MNRILTGLAALLLSTTALVACASGAPSASTDDAQASAAPQESEASESAASDAPPADSTIPAGARAASEQFPFPVPEDWPELMAFTEEKIGKAVGMSGSFAHPGEAQSDAEVYRQLLKRAEFAIHPNPLGEQVHAASFIVEGAIQGTAYSGTIDFDTDAGGTQRVVINLTED